MVAKRDNPALPHTVLEEVWDWMKHGATIHDAVERLTTRTIPPGHEFYNWKSGMCDVQASMVVSTDLVSTCMQGKMKEW